MLAVRRSITYGPDSVEKIPALVARLHGEKVLLVCGQRSFEASGASRIITALERVAEVVRWSEFSTNTDSVDVARGIRLARSLRPRLILGIGGGSALDMAKLLCLFDEVPGPEQLMSTIRSRQAIDSRSCRLILVPTTSGSGSEATHFAVVYINEEKHSVAGASLRPDVAVLDPRLSLSASASQRATSGIDAICHAIESLWAVGATPTSQVRAKRALQCLLANIEGFVSNPSLTSAKAMAIGSHLAGRSIDISRTTGAHALSYGFTKRWGIEHGQAVALTLGAFIERHAAADATSLHKSKGADEHQAAMATILEILGVTTGAEARPRFAALLERIGLATRISDIVASTEDDLNRLAVQVNAERLSNNPVVFTRAEIESILRDSR